MTIWKRALEPPVAIQIANGLYNYRIYYHKGSLGSNVVLDTPTYMLAGIGEDNPESGDWVAIGPARQMSIIMRSDVQLPDSIVIEGLDNEDEEHPQNISRLEVNRDYSSEVRSFSIDFFGLNYPYVRVIVTNGDDAATEFSYTITLKFQNYAGQRD